MRINITTEHPVAGKIVLASLDPDKAVSFANENGQYLFKDTQGRYSTFDLATNEEGQEEYVNGELINDAAARAWLSEANASEDTVSEFFPAPGKRGRKSVGPRVSFNITQDMADAISQYVAGFDGTENEAMRAVFEAGIAKLKLSK